MFSARNSTRIYAQVSTHNPKAVGSNPAPATKSPLISPEISGFSLFSELFAVLISEAVPADPYRDPYGKALLTDITYIFYRGGVCYLSPILDVCTHEVLAYRLSDNLRVDFVLDMVDAMCSKYGAELDNSTIVHSDQGCHYTSNAFIQKLKDASFVQSMSRKGNCWDNAPQESFFGHMKDEIASLIAGCATYEQVQAVVADWMDYYNKDRYQWDLEKLSPREYYCYRQTGVYPLKPGISKNRNSRGSAPDPEV